MSNPAPINPQRLQRLLHRLVNIYSPSGKEGEILKYLHGYLERWNLPVVRQDVGDNRYNLVFSPAEDEVQLVLVGHLDTVPAYDLEHYGSEQEGDIITGLGAADMKSGCAAMVEAFVALSEQKSTWPPVALALVVGEEEEGDGAKELMRDYEFTWALIGEPTDLVPCLSNYGYLEVQLSTRGKRMHASLSSKAKNPVATILRLILHITQYLDENRPELVYNIRDLWSSQAGFVVPESCEGWLDIHLPPSANIAEIMAELEEIIDLKTEKNSFVETMLRFATADIGFDLPEKGAVVEGLKEIYSKSSLPWNPTPFKSHSDASQLWQAGVRPIILGPGQLEKAHAPDESVSFQQVCLAAEIYYRLAMAMNEQPFR